MKKLLFLVLFLSVGFFAFADQDKGEMHEKGDMHGEGCKGMMEGHEKMMGDMKSMDAKLDEMVAAMNSASGDKKVEAMGALVSEMVSQRKKMQSMMMMSMHMMAGCDDDDDDDDEMAGCGGHEAHAKMTGCSDHHEEHGKMSCCDHKEHGKMPCCEGDKKPEPEGSKN